MSVPTSAACRRFTTSSIRIPVHPFILRLSLLPLYRVPILLCRLRPTIQSKQLFISQSSTGCIARFLIFAGAEPLRSPQTPCRRIRSGFRAAFGYISCQTRHHREAGAEDDSCKFRSSGIVDVISMFHIGEAKKNGTLRPEPYLGSNVAEVKVGECSDTVD